MILLQRTDFLKCIIIVLYFQRKRQGIEAPEYCKEYYEFLTEVFEYVKNSYNKTVNRQENIDKAKMELFDYRNKRIVIGGNKKFYKSEYHLQYTQEIVNNVLSALLQTMEDIIEEGDIIKLNGYMTIKPTYCNPRIVRNLYENTEMELPARYKLKIKLGNRLNDACKRFNEKKNVE